MLPTLRDDRVALRPLTVEDVDALAEIVTLPGVREWWGPADDPEKTREDLRMDGDAFAVEAGGELAGWLAFTEENEPGYRSAGVDIILAPGFQDRGLGPAALRLAIAWLIQARGHRRLTIDPAAANARAIAAYERVGFRPVGVMREYELGLDGRWHDGLLMDLLAEELA